MVVTAGLVALAVVARSGLCRGQVGFGPGQRADSREALAQAKESNAPAAPAGSAAGKRGAPVEWVSIAGGTFTMGAAHVYGDEKPDHQVEIKTFEISKTAVTVEQYTECVIAGRCAKPDSGGYCNWGKAGRRRHPVNCVDWDQANQYAKFKRARLPSESEWEYAATGEGRNQDRKYPWGDEDATCERAVMSVKAGPGCGGGGTLPVCSKPAGNTAQGLCDMAGNVWQWVQDKYRSSYAGALADGGASEAGGPERVVRGGSWGIDGRLLRSDARGALAPGDVYGDVGFRIAR